MSRIARQARAHELVKKLNALSGEQDEAGEQGDGAKGQSRDKPRDRPKPTGRRKLEDAGLPEVPVEIADPLFEQLVTEGKAERIGFEESSKLAYERGGLRRVVIKRVKYAATNSQGQTEIAQLARAPGASGRHRAARGLLQPEPLHRRLPWRVRGDTRTLRASEAGDGLGLSASAVVATRIRTEYTQLGPKLRSACCDLAQWSCMRAARRCCRSWLLVAAIEACASSQTARPAEGPSQTDAGSPVDAGASDGGDGGTADAGACASQSPGTRIFNGFAIVHDKDPIPCTAASECEGGRCSRLTEQLGVCDLPVPEATECAPLEFPGMQKNEDECGCEGRSCPADGYCRLIEQTCSCGADHWNICVTRPCESPADCPNGSVCAPSQYVFDNRCIMAECSSDSDCTAHGGGICGLRVNSPFQAGETRLDAIRCFYPHPYQWGCMWLEEERAPR